VKFDKFNDEDFAASTMPDGEHDMEIVKVKSVTSKKTGQEFAVLVLRDVNDSYDQVEKWLSPDNKRDQRTVMDLNAALGRAWDAEIDDSIAGQVVAIASKRAVKDGEPVLDQDGNQRVYVNGFLPATGTVAGAQKPAAAPRANRTATQKADAATSFPNDEIPFLWIVPLLTAIAAGVMA
jgi:hypothetical protein